MNKSNIVNIILTHLQELCVQDICKWYIDKARQIYVLAGYAGTGKTTIIEYIVNALKIKINDIEFATFTGKASLVMTQKANGKYEAKTLHSLLYDVRDLGNGRVEFIPKKQSEFKRLKLIVVDECSMVPNEMYELLIQTGVKILFVGDGGQLPPVEENRNAPQPIVYNRLTQNPDFLLDEVLRQAQDNPIIMLSMMIRKGMNIPYGNYGDKVSVISRNDVNNYAKSLINADIIICHSNATKDYYNNLIRSHKGFTSKFPQVNDKVICIRNNWGNEACGTALVNGMIGCVQKVYGEERNRFSMNVKPDYADDGAFKSKVWREKFLGKKIEKYTKDIYECDDYAFGYAITCHKAQGSQWNKVFVIAERFSDKRWLYTACTRSESYLIIAI